MPYHTYRRDTMNIDILFRTVISKRDSSILLGSASVPNLHSRQVKHNFSGHLAWNLKSCQEMVNIEICQWLIKLTSSHVEFKLEIFLCKMILRSLKMLSDVTAKNATRAELGELSELGLIELKGRQWASCPAKKSDGEAEVP